MGCGWTRQCSRVAGCERECTYLGGADVPKHVVALTAHHLVLLDVRSMVVVERTPLETNQLVANDFHSGLAKRSRPSVPDALGASIQTYRGKIFLLVSH